MLWDDRNVEIWISSICICIYSSSGYPPVAAEDPGSSKKHKKIYQISMFTVNKEYYLEIMFFLRKAK